MNKSFQSITILTILFISIVSIANEKAELSTPEDVVWHWFSNCHDSISVIIEVIIDNKTNYKSSFPVCQNQRKDIILDTIQNLLKFNFSEKSIGHFGNRKHHKIECNIWEAGQEQSCVILGISFTTKDSILLNTLYFAYPNKESQSKIAKGIIIKTYTKTRNP